VPYRMIIAVDFAKAFHLQKTKSKIIARFSDFTGIPNIPDGIVTVDPILGFRSKAYPISVKE
jgi:hypothetical protein